MSCRCRYLQEIPWYPLQFVWFFLFLFNLILLLTHRRNGFAHILLCCDEVQGVITVHIFISSGVFTSPLLWFQAHGIDHLVIPTRDYLFAPSFVDINRAVDFIHSEWLSFIFCVIVLLCGPSSLPFLFLCAGNASSGLTTYVHCKAGRGRSTTVVLCYLVAALTRVDNASWPANFFLLSKLLANFGLCD